MSQENVAIVLDFSADANVDLVPLVRDDRLWAAAAEAAAPLIHPGFEVIGTVIGTERAYVGVDGFRDFLLDWLAPWDEYRSQVDRIIDLGERVLVIYDISGRRDGSAREVDGRGAWIWTIADAKVAGIVGYADPDEALRAVGLEE